MQINTLPVYSKLADAAAIPAEVAKNLPKDWQLSQHQIETYAALCNNDVDVVINTAMTGDGKSLAGLLPFLSNRQHNGILVLYPTNELIQDQYASAITTLPRWNIASNQATTIFGARLDEIYADVEQLSRAEVLQRELNQHRLTLSNPDILHAILQFHYQQYGRSPSHIAGQIAMLFDQLTFDEFHIFETPQVTAILTGLLFLKTQSKELKTLFLSATPSPEVMRLLDRVGLKAGLIEPQRQGWYHHGSDPGKEWRPILQGSHIHFAETTAEEWVANGGDQIILNWFREHRPAAKAAVIVHSVATALRLVDRLKPLFATEGLTVEANTGITGRTIRKESYDADLLIGTSTVDVGVDFKINFLVFEASSAGNFLQRLGRLGRHTNFIDRHHHEQQFQDFAAYALVPSFIYERLFNAIDGQTDPLISDATYTREQLSQKVQEIFPQPTRFEHYTRTWGRFVPAKVIQTLTSKPLKASFQSVTSVLFPAYTKLIQGKIGDAISEWRTRQANQEELLITEALSFRGGSPFDCGLIKDDEREVVTYDLFWLLANAQLELLSQGAFCDRVRQMGKSDLAYQRGFQKFFFRWHGLRTQRELVTIILPPIVTTWSSERYQTAQVLPGIQVDCAGHEFLNELNRRLINQRCVGLVVPAYDPQQLRRKLYLPPSIHLFPYRADSDDAGIQMGTIAFGRDALLLDSRLQARPLNTQCDKPMIY
ncbi:DEAD/DEAH box helicase-like protein [Oscillochloris trichoides DG-6]|uniref:DEAD/DEAH box helicase-like protein n=1 Tax=Oscillochloris trichoides DG-6 TaxID=765420 RepID=E1IAC9_9CHLR|nr:type I-D CRISPR-associated helicase Cas3' [Oscillochloris trichoides]EFO81883.1 DEAD/DEAH box helicase-like protein [Oscillochloris trichoides DG-6]